MGEFILGMVAFGLVFLVMVSVFVMDLTDNYKKENKKKKDGRFKRTT